MSEVSASANDKLFFAPRTPTRSCGQRARRVNLYQSCTPEVRARRSLAPETDVELVVAVDVAVRVETEEGHGDAPEHRRGAGIVGADAVRAVGADFTAFPAPRTCRTVSEASA
jgi:hypothetical protein